MNDLEQELRFRHAQRAVATEMAMDHGYTVARIGSYKIIEGAGREAGSWFAEGRGEVKRFSSRAQAEQHANISNDTAMDATDPDLREKRKRLRDKIAGLTKESDRLMATRGIKDTVNAPKIEALQRELDALGRDEDPFTMGNDAVALNGRTEETLIHQINTSLRLMGKPEIKRGQYSLKELEELYRKVNR